MNVFQTLKKLFMRDKDRLYYVDSRGNIQVNLQKLAKNEGFLRQLRAAKSLDIKGSGDDR